VVDVHEPKEIVERLNYSLSTTVTSLEGAGYCDYLWWAADGHPITVERKSVQDFSNRIDALEIQLKKAIKQVGDKGEVVFLLEGVMDYADGSAILYQRKRDGSVFYRTRFASRPYKYFQGFIYRIQKLGVDYYSTASIKGTVAALVEFVKASQQESYTTFSRYIRTRNKVKDLDEQVQILYEMGVGVTKAEALIARFGTVWNVINASEKELLEVNGIGKKFVETWLHGLIGKP
jgi:ERCC4-type nuclease